MLGRAVAVVVVVVGGLLVAACGSGDDTANDDRPEPRPDEVTKTELTLVDTSRTTPADAFRDLPEKADRTLSVMVLAPESQSDEPLPLIVFAHGHSRLGTEYEVFDGGGDQAALTEQAILAFFARHLQGDGEAWPAFAQHVGSETIATLAER